MAEQAKLNLEYSVDGWPVQKNRDVAKATPEEKLLAEALNVLMDVDLAPLPVITKRALERVRGCIEPVYKVVSDYSHMQAKVEELQARVDELEDELDSANSANEELESQLAELEEDNPDPDARG